MDRTVEGDQVVNMLATVKWGSKLYGTAVPESDDDLRSVYLPSATDCFLGQIQHSVEVEDVEDSAIMSLQSFCRLDLEGQSIAIEMLHAPTEMITLSSPVWRTLQINRHRFYTKHMAAFMSFSRSMSAKYALRVDRLKECEAIMEVFKREALFGSLDHVRLSALWGVLPSSPNAVKGENPENRHADKRVYRVCGRELQATVFVPHAITVIGGIISQFGERVRAAKDGKLDYKALSHAFRVTLQAKEIVETGHLHFPLKDADWLRNVRLGRIDFFKEGLDKRLDDLIAEVQAKMDASDLPDEPDRKWVEKLIVDVYYRQIDDELFDNRHPYLGPHPLDNA